LQFDPKSSILAIDYVIKNLQFEAVSLHFGMEFVCILLAIAVGWRDSWTSQLGLQWRKSFKNSFPL